MGEKDGDTPPTAEGAETAEGGAAAQEQPVNDVAREGGGGGSDEEESDSRSVAVKIQQVPVDEVCSGVVHGAFSFNTTTLVFVVGLGLLRRAFL